MCGLVVLIEYQMENFEGYDREKRTISIVKANKVALLITIGAALLFGMPFYLIWRHGITLSLKQNLLFIVLFLVGIVVHELIHGFFFGLFAPGGFRSIRFGIMWKYLTPYCHCKEPLRIRHYFIGALMPAILLGFVPAVVSLFTGNDLWLVLGIIFIGAAAGDFMVVWILKKEDKNVYVQDHPSEAGCYVYHKRDDNANDEEEDNF